MDENKTNSKQQAQQRDSKFTVVGIGASAGGLAALRTFFDNMPPNTGMAFVVIMHLSPEHQSHLPQLLQSHTEMPVTQVAQTVAVAPNHIYVIPPNCNLSAIDTHLRLTELEESRRQRAPIDHFFRTLAGTHGSKAIGVVLSGTGSDGSVGLKQIKEDGGLTVVQDPTEAEYDSMPQNAIVTGLIDLVLPVAEMPAKIRSFVRTEPRLPDQAEEEAEEAPPTDEDLLQKVFVQLRTQTGDDFSGYKRTTVMRRVRRRMQLQQIEELSDYLHMLRGNREEIESLRRDLLITVTNFFRDEDAFAALADEAIPRLFAGKSGGDTVRAWAVGCATGEEAYSVAMLLLEHRSKLEEKPEIRVFASDISDDALALAREGIYPDVIGADVSPQRLERFFVKESSGYRIKKAVRDVVLFAEHNVLNDPPFSKLDLITCRNLLIYLQREIQEKVIELFHYALRPSGFLFLGSSESLSSTELFQDVNKKTGLHQRRAVSSSQLILPALPLVSRRLQASSGAAPQQQEGERPSRDSFGALHQEMVERYAPPSMVVNEDFNIVHLSQGAGRYLHQPGGEPTHNVLRRIRPALRVELTAALYGAFEREQPSHTKPVRLTLDGEPRRVSMSVHPATAPELVGYVLVLFMDMADVTPKAVAVRDEAEMDSMVQQLETELARTKERLQTAVEEFESSKEEMRASNEELQSMNEELHSTAEELESSKEELQSMNEELLTVNQENKNKVEELSHLAGDLQNLLAATDVATLFLNRELQIRRFTPKVGDLFNIIEADRGRPLAHITHKLHDDGLLQDARSVLDTLQPVEREMESENGRFYLVRLRPYRSIEDRIDGVVITFVDVTEMKQAEAELRASNEFQRNIVQSVREGLLVLDLDLRVEFANDSFYEMFQVSPEGTEGKLIYHLGNGQWDIPALRTLLEEILPDNKVFNDYEVRHEFDGVGERVMLLNGRRLNGQQRILLAIEDITERQQALAELQQLTNQLEQEVARRTKKK